MPQSVPCLRCTACTPESDSPSERSDLRKACLVSLRERPASCLAANAGNLRHRLLVLVSTHRAARQSRSSPCCAWLKVPSVLFVGFNSKSAAQKWAQRTRRRRNRQRRVGWPGCVACEIDGFQWVWVGWRAVLTSGAALSGMSPRGMMPNETGKILFRIQEIEFL